MRSNKKIARSGIMLLEYDKYPDPKVIEMFHIRDAIRMAYIKDSLSCATSGELFECAIWRKDYAPFFDPQASWVISGCNLQYFDYLIDFLVNNRIDKITANKRWEETNDSLIVHPAYRAVVLFKENVFLVTDNLFKPSRLSTKKLIINMSEDKKLTGAKFSWKIED